MTSSAATSFAHGLPFGAEVVVQRRRGPDAEYEDVGGENEGQVIATNGEYTNAAFDEEWYVLNGGGSPVHVR